MARGLFRFPLGAIVFTAPRVHDFSRMDLTLLRRFGWRGGVWVGSGVSEAREAFCTTPATVYGSPASRVSRPKWRRGLGQMPSRGSVGGGETYFGCPAEHFLHANSAARLLAQ